jgi:hypothetical protein
VYSFRSAERYPAAHVIWAEKRSADFNKTWMCRHGCHCCVRNEGEASSANLVLSQMMPKPKAPRDETDYTRALCLYTRHLKHFHGDGRSSKSNKSDNSARGKKLLLNVGPPFLPQVRELNYGVICLSVCLTELCACREQMQESPALLILL